MFNFTCEKLNFTSASFVRDPCFVLLPELLIPVRVHRGVSVTVEEESV